MPSHPLGTSGRGLLVLFLFGFLAAAGCGGDATPVPAPVSRPGPVLGIAASPKDPADSPEADKINEDMFAVLRDAGMSSLRFDFLWQEIEPAPGEFHFDKYDRMVDQALGHGFTVLGILCYGTPWATTRPVLIPGLSQVPPPDDPRTFAAYAAAVAEHFKGRVLLWEIWNEPNNGFRFWSPTMGGDPVGYARLLRAGYEGIKGDPADPGDGACEECTVAFAGLSDPWCYDFLGITGGLAFLDRVHADARTELGIDLGDYYDVLAFHIYMYPPFQVLLPPFDPPEVPDPLGYDAATEQNRLASWVQVIADTRSVLAKHGLSKDLWLTEFGWPTNHEWPGIGLPRGVTPREQAQYTVRSMVLSLASDVERLYLFTYRDGPNNLLYQETAFGIVAYDPDYPETVMAPTAKPAFHAIKVFTGLTGHARYERDLRDELQLPEDAFAFRFLTPAPPRERITVLWSLAPDRETEVALPVSSTAGTTLLDLYGVPFAPEADPAGRNAGSVRLKLSPGPVYVVESTAVTYRHPAPPEPLPVSP